MINLLIWILIAVAVFGLIWYALSQIPLPPPMRVVVNVILVIIAIIVLIYLAQSLLGAPPHVGRL